MSEPWVIENVTAENIASHRDQITDLYAEHGVVIFPGMLATDPDFAAYLADLRYLFGRLLAREGATMQSEDMGDLIVEVSKTNPLAGQIVADIGTQPNKLCSANRIKFGAAVSLMLECVFGPDAIVGSPQAGDTLHLFMPGTQFHRYNLPVHQDYQYLMQSPRQATLYMGMSNYHEGVGGLDYWPGSHKLGVLKSTLNQNGSFIVCDSDTTLKGLDHKSYFWNPGDLGIFDSLMCHRSIPNATQDHGRVVQIMRFSDLRDAEAERVNWRSTVYPRRGVNFKDAHSDLFVEPATADA